MATVLLTSEKFVKSFTNIDDNLSAAYLMPAVRESQDIELTTYLGSALVTKLQDLVSSNTINDSVNTVYKGVLEKVQYFLAYSAIAKVIPICGVKITNFGITQAQDENIRTLDVEDIPTAIGWYQKKADAYAGDLLRYVLSQRDNLPELNECAAGQIKAHLNSSASSGLWLGGVRGRRKVGGSSCCGGTSGGHSGGGGEGSVVTWEQTVTGGTKIATISINGKSTEVFVPEGISEEDVNTLISQAIETETARTESTYAKTGETQDLDERLTDVESELAGLEVPSVYYIDGDSISDYSDAVDEIYRKLASGETVFVGSKYDYAKFPVGRAEIYEYQESDPSNPSEYLRREGFSVPVTRTDGADNYLLRYGTFSAFRYEGRDGEGHSAGLSWNENTLAISPLTLTAKISTGGTIYMNANEDNNSSNLDKLYRLTKDSRNGIIMAKVYDLRINSAIAYVPVKFFGFESGNTDFYSNCRFTFDYTDSGVTYRTLWTWDRSQPADTRIVLDSCEEVSEDSDYVIVEDLSAITSPREGMVAFVKSTIAVDRLANVSAYKLSGWAGGMAQFVAGEDYTINRNQVNSKWGFPYRTGTPDFSYYWTELDPGVYIRYQGGNLWVAWNSEDYPNATMMGNNFKGSDDKWGENSGQTFYITLSHNEGLNIYRNGKWVPMKKQYWFQDCISSSALTEEICHRTAEGEMDITLVENDGVMICQYSSPNSWNVGSTAFIMLRVDTNSNHLQYFRKFVNWDSYNWAQDANWDYTLPQANGPTVIDFDALTQQERADVYDQFSGVTSASTVNQDYIFLKSFTGSGYITRTPQRIQLLYSDGNMISFGTAAYDGNYNFIAAMGIRLYSDGNIDQYDTTFEKGLSGINRQQIFRDYWYVYYDTTTSGFSYGVDTELTPITWGTGNTCSGMWVFSEDMVNQLLTTPGSTDMTPWFSFRMKTSEGTRLFGYPSISRVELDTPVTLIDSESQTLSFSKKMYFDYGEFVLSFYYGNDWRFGGINIQFR